ncbi:MAG: class I SAM-dependent methyltransferase [Cyanobacteria bacterium J06598_3]
MGTTERDCWQTWYESFDETYSPEKRRQWYSSAAKAYRWARPRYPDALIDSVLRQAGLVNASEASATGSILEIGCGPGIATEALVQRGLRVQAVEPSPVACELARESCKAYEPVHVHNSTFEDYPLAGQTFDAVLAATSFHWVSPAVACKKSAAALNPGGSLILLWATPPQPSEAICQYLQTVYDRFGLSELGHNQHRTQAYYQHNFKAFAHTVADSGLFPLTAVEVQTHHSPHSIEKYLALLSTLSDYIALDEWVRVELLDALGQHLTAWLEREGAVEEMSLTHWFAAQVTSRIGTDK